VVVADLETELVDVELAGRILIENVDAGMREPLNHGDLLYGVGE
jgi:hypothetical protein